MWLAPAIYCANKTVCQSQPSLEFSSLFCKYERPCPDGDFKRGSGRPHTRPWRLYEPFPSTHQTPADKSSSRWHNEVHHSFQLCVKCDILCLLFHVSTLQPVCEELTGQSRQPPCSLDTSHWGQHQSPESSLGSKVRDVYTHTRLTQRKRRVVSVRNLPLVASSRNSIVSCRSRGRPAD